MTLLKKHPDYHAEVERLNRTIQFMTSYLENMWENLLDRYLVAIEREMLPQEDVMLEEYLIMPHEEIESLFTVEFSYLPLIKRLEQVKKKISIKLKQKKKEILEAVRDSYELKLVRARSSFKDPEGVNQKVVDLIEERDQKIARIVTPTAAFEIGKI